MKGAHYEYVFKQITGLTPPQYAAAHREQRLRNALERSGTVTAAIFDAGYRWGVERKRALLEKEKHG